MLKAFTPVAVLALSALTGLEKVTFLEINIILIISVGVALTSLGEMQFSMVGFIFQALAIMFESGRLVMTNMFLKKLNLDSLSTLYYIAPMCGAVIGCACIAFELPNLPAEFLLSWRFWGILIANGMVAFSLNIASVMLIKHTSALTLTLSGVIKDILLVLLSLAIFKSPVAALQYLGYSVSLLALNLHKEYKKNSALFEATQTTQTQTAPSSPIAFISGSNGTSHATGGVEMGRVEMGRVEMGRVGDNGDEEEDAPLITGSGSLIPGESLTPGG
jgi:drug/metabolite transporter (DMT)-like permease